jgi:hypothetical protein
MFLEGSAHLLCLDCFYVKGNLIWMTHDGEQAILPNNVEH